MPTARWPRLGEPAERIVEVMDKIDRKYGIDTVLASFEFSTIWNKKPRRQDGEPDLLVVFDSCVNDLGTEHARWLVHAFYQLVGVDTFYVTPTTWKFFKWQDPKSTGKQLTISFT